MSSASLAEGRSGRYIQAAIYAVGLPVVLVGALYLVSQAVGVLFGNLVFWLTLAMFLVWVVVWAAGRRGRAEREPASDHGSTGQPTEPSRALTVFGSPLMAVAVVVTMTVVLGWLVVLVDLAVTGS